MSERDSGAEIIVWLLLAAAAMFFIYTATQRMTTMYWEVRDLQRRVGQLETKVK